MWRGVKENAELRRLDRVFFSWMKIGSVKKIHAILSKLPGEDIELPRELSRRRMSRRWEVNRDDIK